MKGVVSNNSVKLFYATPEAPPYMQQGGLGTVAGVLPRALQGTGHVDVTVVTPYYPTSVKKLYSSGAISSTPEKVKDGYLPFGDGKEQFGIYAQKLNGVPHLFIAHKEFDGSNPYSYSEDGPGIGNQWLGRRFAFFSGAAVEAIKTMGFVPDIIHANDWTTALMLGYLKYQLAQDPAWANTQSLITVHSALHQGQFDKDAVAEVRLPESVLKEFEVNGGMNFLVGGLHLADAVNTVSPTYLKELMTMEHGAGIEDVFRWVSRNKTFAGILNGNDYETNNPMTSKVIPHNYSPDDLSGKRENKLHLLDEAFGSIDKPEEPLLLMISRLTEQKGIDVLGQAHVELMQRNLKFIVMGMKDKDHVWFGLLDGSSPSKVRVYNSFDLNLAQRLFAGADLFIMPSRTEPCGLAQMEAMAYGVPSVVNGVGGLRDTVTEFDPSSGEGLGFAMENYSKESFIGSVDRALGIYYKKPEMWQMLVKNCMNARYTWQSSAKQYYNLYEQMLKR